nr:hypothetical protein [Tanacetum cinerariifolium]
LSSDSHATITYTSMSSYEVIVNGYYGMPMDPLDPYVQLVMEAPLSPDYIPGPEAPLSPDYIPGPEAPLSPDYIPGPEAPPSPDYIPGPEYPKMMLMMRRKRRSESRDSGGVATRYLNGGGVAVVLPSSKGSVSSEAETELYTELEQEQSELGAPPFLPHYLRTPPLPPRCRHHKTRLRFPKPMTLKLDG